MRRRESMVHVCEKQKARYMERHIYVAVGVAGGAAMSSSNWIREMSMVLQSVLATAPQQLPLRAATAVMQ
jgi:hypothetical protein